MDIYQLRSFVAIADAGSYSNAADLLEVPQSTLSRQVRALEVELRASLFHRHGRGVRLTDRGKKFIEYARSVLHTVNAAMAAVRDFEAEYTGHLIVGLPPSVGRLLIPSLAPQLVAQFPHATISLTEGLSGALYERVLLGQVDFAVVMSPAPSPNLLIEPLTVEYFYLVGAQRAGGEPESITMEELAKVPLILPHSRQWTRSALESAMAQRGWRAQIVLEVDASFSAIDLVSKGLGYAVMPSHLRRLESHPGLSWQKIVEPHLEVSISMISSNRRPRSALAESAALVVKETLLTSFRAGTP